MTAILHVKQKVKICKVVGCLVVLKFLALSLTENKLMQTLEDDVFSPQIALDLISYILKSLVPGEACPQTPLVDTKSLVDTK